RPTSPCRAATASPAAPCAKTPSAAASYAASPCARSAPITPARTSPVPPLAMPGLPVGQMAVAPTGLAMTVRAPFSTTTTRSARAKARAAHHRPAIREQRTRRRAVGERRGAVAGVREGGGHRLAHLRLEDRLERGRDGERGEPRTAPRRGLGREERRAGLAARAGDHQH